MKNWQFITLLLLVLVWFGYLWFRINTLQGYVTNIDNNVAKVDEKILWDVVPKLEYTEATLEEMNASVDYMYKAISSVY